MAGLVLLVGLGARGSLKPAGQAFTYTYALFILFGVTYLNVGESWSHAWRVSIPIVVLLWLGGQVLLGAIMPHTDLVHMVIPLAEVRQRARYNIDPILRVLDTRRADAVLVSVPDDEYWAYNMFLQYAFAPYHPTFQNGILMDNTNDYRNLLLPDSKSVYRYAVVARDADYVGFEQMGEVVAEAGDLLLYELHTYDPELIAAQAAALWQAQSQDPIFPSLATAP